MIVFFTLQESVSVRVVEGGLVYEHHFRAVNDPTRQSVTAEHVYFTTPTNFGRLMEMMRRNGKQSQIFVATNEQIMANPNFPKDIGFGDLAKLVEPFKDRPKFKVAILNAMSNAVGDHLIGCSALRTFRSRLKELLPGTEISITPFQLNPHRMLPVTEQALESHEQIVTMPNTLDKLMGHDAYINFSSLIARPGFDDGHIYDFYFKGLSIDPASVPVERKRCHFEVQQEIDYGLDLLFDNIRIKSGGRPVLMFHRLASSPVRSMSPARARQVILSIIKKTNYFVIAADDIEFHHSRFMNVNDFTPTLGDLAAVIRRADGLVTVDTCLYHFADAVGTPAVVLFTSIDPAKRTKYYPLVASVMLEEPGGENFGLHKADHGNPERMQEQTVYTDKLWEKLDVNQVLILLQDMIRFKGEKV